ncbi:hypothetical protein MMC07_000308 [Pseudocyphellaria aurata]|nr:hypothetical protein [Pseudocyphellaria aurata]
MAGGLCGLVSWACIYPIDSAKTHYQRNCLTKGKGEPVPMPSIRFFERKMYRGEVDQAGEKPIPQDFQL